MTIMTLLLYCVMFSVTSYIGLLSFRVLILRERCGCFCLLESAPYLTVLGEQRKSAVAAGNCAPPSLRWDHDM